jgi:small subunit ribosomal protein S8
MDVIGDFLTRIRNANMAKHKVLEVPSSNMRKAITKILYEQGYILNYKFEDAAEGKFPSIKIALKYNPSTKQPVIKGIKRVSRPGLRKYASVSDMPRVLNGLGIAIISTSHGIITDKEARKQNVGGEVICYVY